MYRNNYNAVRITMVIDTILAVEVCKAPVDKLRIESLVPHLTILFCAIQAALQLPDMILKAMLNEALGLLHEAYFVRIQDAVVFLGKDN